MVKDVQESGAPKFAFKCLVAYREVPVPCICLVDAW